MTQDHSKTPPDPKRGYKRRKDPEKNLKVRSKPAKFPVGSAQLLFSVPSFKLPDLGFQSLASSCQLSFQLLPALHIPRWQEIQESENPEIWKYGIQKIQKIQSLKIKICVAQNVGKVWTSSKKTPPGPICGHFWQIYPWTENSKNCRKKKKNLCLIKPLMWDLIQDLAAKLNYQMN